MEECDSFLFPQKELGELLNTCCHGDHLATLHLPLRDSYKAGGNQRGKKHLYLVRAICLQRLRGWNWLNHERRPQRNSLNLLTRGCMRHLFILSVLHTVDVWEAGRSTATEANVLLWMDQQQNNWSHFKKSHLKNTNIRSSVCCI